MYNKTIIMEYVQKSILSDNFNKCLFPYICCVYLYFTLCIVFYFMAISFNYDVHLFLI